MAVLWKQIYESERNRLLAGCFQPSQFFHTVGSLAVKYGVSEITTRRVLSELAREGLLQNIPRVGSIVVDRVRNPRIFLLSPQRMGYEEETQVVSEILKGIFEAAIQCGWEVIPVSQDFLQSDYTEECHLIYLYNCNLMGSDEFLSQVPDTMHLLGLHTPGPMKRGKAVCNDYQGAVESIVADLARVYRRVAYVGPTSGRWFQERYESYLAGLQRAGCVFQQQQVFSCALALRQIPGAEMQSFLAAMQPDAVFFPSLQWLNLWLAFCSSPEASPTSVGLPMAAIGGHLPKACRLPNLRFCLEDGAQIGREAIRLIHMSQSGKRNTARTVYVPIKEVPVLSY